MRGLHDTRMSTVEPRVGGLRCGDARRPAALIPRFGVNHLGFLHDTEALRRRHGFLASRRARRLNLRPPGAC